jgi:hypothetical protein
MDRATDIDTETEQGGGHGQWAKGNVPYGAFSGAIIVKLRKTLLLIDLYQKLVYWPCTDRRS